MKGCKKCSMILAENHFYKDQSREDGLSFYCKECTRLYMNERKKKMNRSGQIPDGDARLTANIKEELHTRLKIEAARRRICMGDLVEELIEAGTRSADPLFGLDADAPRDFKNITVKMNEYEYVRLKSACGDAERGILDYIRKAIRAAIDG